MPDVNSNHDVNSSSNGATLEYPSGTTVVTILHFNDCYNVEPRTLEPAGGAARFKSALKTFDAFEPIVLFSGDILGPSISKFNIYSSIT